MSLIIKNLSFFYDKQIILKQLNLNLPESSVSAITGNSGQGKTTLLRCISGLEAVTQGTIYWKKTQFNGSSTAIPPWKRNMSMVFQELALWPHICVKDHLQLVLKHQQAQQCDSSLSVEEILSEFEIDTLSQRYPAQLSLGQQQRLAIARALIADPALLLLDEPFSSLDERMTLKCWEYIHNWHTRVQSSILYVSHDLQYTIEQTGHIFHMSNGKLRKR